MKKKKDLKYYLSLPYRFEVEPDAEDGGYVGWYPDLPGCITYADTTKKLLENLEDAKQCWFEAALEDNKEIPEPCRADDYSGQFKLRIPKALHMSLAKHSKEQGISMNQYCLYLLSKNDTEYAIHAG